MYLKKDLNFYQSVDILKETPCAQGHRFIWSQEQALNWFKRSRIKFKPFSFSSFHWDASDLFSKCSFNFFEQHIYHNILFAHLNRSFTKSMCRTSSVAALSLDVSSSLSSSSCCLSSVFCSSSDWRSLSNCCSSSCGERSIAQHCQKQQGNLESQSELKTLDEKFLRLKIPWTLICFPQISDSHKGETVRVVHDSVEGRS